MTENLPDWAHFIFGAAWAGYVVALWHLTATTKRKD